MTIVADEQKRLILPTAQPGDRFDVQITGDGKFLLTRLSSLSSHPTNVKIVKEGAFSVGVLDRPIDEHALAEALSEFP